MIRDVIGDSDKWTQCCSLFNTIYVYISIYGHAFDVDIQMVYINMSMLILSCILLFVWEISVRDHEDEITLKV